MPSRMIACSLGLLAFAAATVVGMIVGNPAITTLWRALLAMVLCYAVGAAAGAVAERALREHIEQYKRAHPLDEADRPTKDAAGAEGSAPEAQETPDGPQQAPAEQESDRNREGEAASPDGGATSAAAREPAAA